MTKKTASVFKEELIKSEENAKKKDEIFNKLQQMAIQRSIYHPNASGGSGSTGHGFSCDATPIHDESDSDNEWDD